MSSRCTSYGGASSGFTLLEVVIAVLVIAIAFGGLLQALALQADRLAEMRLRLLAGWAADNRIAEMLLAASAPVSGELVGETRQGGVALYWRQRSVPAGDANLQRIDVEVGRAGETAVLARRSVLRER